MPKNHQYDLILNKQYVLFHEYKQNKLYYYCEIDLIYL
jgi:hypothetical protein